MHIAFFTDNSPATLGGMQTAVNLQREFLERAGHTVTVCAPRTRQAPAAAVGRSEDLALPSLGSGELTLGLAGQRVDRLIDQYSADRPPVDVVHLHADSTGAWNGTRFARRHGLPVVHTFHTDIDAGVRAAVPLPDLVLQALFTGQAATLGTPRARSTAEFFRTAATLADAVVAPSEHFARQLRRDGLRQALHVVPTGVHDDWVHAARREPRRRRPRPVLVLPGRISAEKRPFDAIEAFARSGVPADLVFYGTGAAERRCRELVLRLGVADRVHFAGRVDQATLLRALRDADGVLQTSVGFETQGLTVYEAIAVGTPVVVRDPEIAADLPARWITPVADGSVAALARAIRRWSFTLAPQSAPDDHLQSTLTRRTLDLYDDVLSRHGARRSRSPVARVA